MYICSKCRCESDDSDNLVRADGKLYCPECLLKLYTVTCTCCNKTSQRPGIRYSLTASLHFHRNNISKDAHPYAPNSGEMWTNIHFLNGTRTKFRAVTDKYICTSCFVERPALGMCSFSGVVSENSYMRDVVYNGDDKQIWIALYAHCRHFSRSTVCLSLCDACGNVSIEQDCTGWCRRISSCSVCHRDNTSGTIKFMGVMNPARQVQSYSYSPRLVFCTRAEKYSVPHQKSMFFGMEIEVDIDRDYSSNDVLPYLRNVPQVYVKTDGSINHGVELVTHPLSAGFWKGFDGLFSALETLRHELGANGDSNGIHIHMSRSPFCGGVNELKLRTFIYTFMDAYPGTYNKIVQRPPNSYCRKFRDCRNFAVKVECIHADSDRYNALNFQNKGTIELRSFRATTDKTQILSYIEFCQAGIDFALKKEQSYLEGNPFLTDFYRHLAKHPRAYKNLIGRIKDENIGGNASAVL